MQFGASDDTHAHTARARRTWSSLVLGGLVLAAVLSTRWVRLNLSPSVPYGLYRLTALGAPLTRGTLVMLPVPARVQAWHHWWIPLLKPVAGVPGDTVCHLDHTLFIHGTSYGPIHQEAHGQPLPQLDAGCQTVPEGMVFLASTAHKSLDSRYFSPVNVSDITALATPLWTWR